MNGRVWALGAASLLVVSQLIAGAQGPTFRSGTELVSLNVTVVGADAKPVTGLTQDQFNIFEDGVAQTVKFFSPGDLPLDVVVLLDTSASMAGSLELVQNAAIRFTQALRPEDRESVMGICRTWSCWWATCWSSRDSNPVRSMWWWGRRRCIIWRMTWTGRRGSFRGF